MEEWVLVIVSYDRDLVYERIRCTSSELSAKIWSIILREGRFLDEWKIVVGRKFQEVSPSEYHVINLGHKRGIELIPDAYWEYFLDTVHLYEGLTKLMDGLVVGSDSYYLTKISPKVI